MTSAWKLTISLFAVTLACGEPSNTYTSPPAGSFTTMISQLKSGQAMVGRVFVGGDDTSSSAHVAVLSHGIWTDRFDGSPTVIGREIELDGRRMTVAGVAPRGFTVPGGTDVWIPKRQD